jgi:hypothetical protein
MVGRLIKRDNKNKGSRKMYARKKSLVNFFAIRREAIMCTDVGILIHVFFVH